MTSPSLTVSSRGAARVSITWLISLIVLLFVALAFGYIGYEEASKSALAEEAALAEKAVADARWQEDGDAVLAISKEVGFYDATTATPRTDPAAVVAGLEDLKATFSDLGDDTVNLAAALPVVKAAFLKRGQEIATLNDSIATLKSENATMVASLQAVARDKDAELSSLRTQLQDDAASAAQKESELEGRIADLNTQRNDLDAQVRALRGEIIDIDRTHASARTTWEVRTQAITEALRFLDEPEASDGQILAVSTELGLGWISIGAQNRLGRGTRFRVVSGAVGSEHIKAWATVTRVEATQAEVMFDDVTDTFDPVVAGDVIYNPLFDPTGERQAVLAGRFSGQFNEGNLEVLLSGMGIKVQDELDFSTDYLIVGSDMFVDEEGTPLDDPLSPVDLPVYKDAQANGVQIVPLTQLRSYFVL